MKALNALIPALLIGSTAFAADYSIQTKDLKFNSSGCDGTCAVAFEIGYTVGTHDGWSREIDGKAAISLNPFTISDALVVVPAPSLTTGKIALRDKHMHEVIESDKFSEISFRLTSPITSDAVASLKPGDEVKVVANGVWTMHGVSKDVSIPMKVKVLTSAGNPVLIRAKFDLNNPDFGIQKYTYLGLSTEDTATITLNLQMHTP